MFILRSFIYLFVVAFVAYLVTLEGEQMKTLAVYSEHTLTEHLQDMMTFSSCMLFLYASRFDSKLRVVSVMCAALMGMMFIRENDALLDQYVFDGAWQVIVVFILLALFVYLWGKFSTIYGSLKAFAEYSFYGTFVAGLVTVLAFSRILGRGSFWTSLMGDQYMRVVKNVVEEGVETLGYTLITISAVELVLVCVRNYNRANSVVKQKKALQSRAIKLESDATIK